MQDLSYLRIWGYKISVYIPQKKQIKRQKRAVSSQKSFFIGYKAQNIYKIFIKKMSKTESLRDIKFMENNQLLAIYLLDE